MTTDHQNEEQIVNRTVAVSSTRVFSPLVLVGIAVFSLIYFADIFIRSSHKLYWYDELFTVYLCRLPTFKATWHAVLQGSDFNPPLFYLLTRFTQSLFGHGMIATRLPETVGVWVFCISLFVFVSKRAGRVAGIVAGLFPFFTLAQYYAYEARPHGLVTGWCGVALVCWQNTEKRERRLLWSALFGACLLAAAMSHVYAIYLLIPFGCAEIYYAAESRTLRWANIAALCVAPIVAEPIFVPMLKAYRDLFGTAGGLMLSPETILEGFLSKVLGPAIPIFALMLVAFALRQSAKVERLERGVSIPVSEVILAIVFVLLPIFGVAGVRFSHGIFFDRYFLSSIAGWAILLGFGVSGRYLRSWVPGFLAVSMFILMLSDLGVAIHHARSGSLFSLREPAADIPFSPGPNDPLYFHSAVAAAPRDEDILVLRAHHYIYLFQYAPPSMTSHLYYGALPGYKMFEVAYRKLSFWAHLDMKVTELEEFVRTRDKFLVYGGYAPWQPDCGDCVMVFQQAGFVLKGETRDEGGVLYFYERREPSQAVQ